MTMPHKICPQCGQPAVLAMTQCQRCGFAYGPGTSASPPGFPHSTHPREIPRAQLATLQSRRRGPLALLVVLGLGVVIMGAIALTGSLHKLSYGRSQRSGVDAAPTEAEAPPGKLSLFVESDSRQEMPVLTFRNFSYAKMTLTLRDRYGHVYRGACDQAQEATLQVPAGEYSVSIDSDSPRIHPNWGDATFRKFKAYDASFSVGHSDTRVHLGE